ncbi:hypothetical protein R1sor_011671 [Riccia sorocarpa]|uniref:Reverse transcriptase domain-containing protein n=1 Tax=Riccia sorocarpa TaxID=122646 RepID=A0ABD3I5E7_9MARC
MAHGIIKRLQGLVTGGAAQVHVNGQFTKRFEVTRGVRQGCPVAPLLFAMVTQPLMRLFREEETRGRLLGVNYGGQSTLLHQIYADDTGVNLTMAEGQFNRLREIIQVFEEISGAKLNLSKSLIMPIHPSVPPDWITTTGCDIAGPGRNFLYLGVSTSSPVNETQIVKAITKKLLNRLKHWSNRLLSWPARIILLKQVLAATPLYQLLSVGMEAKGIESLEVLCRQFLWGWAEQEQPKAAMVAWERTAGTDGGLGWTPLQIKARALQVKNMIKIMQSSSAEWTRLAESLILRTLRQGRYQCERRQWRISEALLLSNINKILGSRTLTRMWTAWSAVRRRIGWDDRCRELPEHLTLEQGMQLKHWSDREHALSGYKITGLLRKAGIHNLKEGAELIRSNRSWLSVLVQMGLFPEESERVQIENLEEWTRSKTLVSKELHEVGGWQWKNDGRPVKWDLSTKEWTERLGTRKEFSEYLNGKWGSNNTVEQWRGRWTKLWTADIHHRWKAWTWRFLQRGYFTASRGKGWSEEMQRCPKCRTGRETLEHTFWECRHIAGRILDLKNCGAIPSEVNSLLQWIDYALLHSRQDSSFLWIFGVFINTTWRERNDMRFRGQKNTRPLRALLRQASLEIEAFPIPTISDRAFQVTRTAKERVTGWALTSSNRDTQQGRRSVGEYLSPSEQQPEEFPTESTDRYSTTTGRARSDGPTQDHNSDERVSSTKGTSKRWRFRQGPDAASSPRKGAPEEHEHRGQVRKVTTSYVARNDLSKMTRGTWTLNTDYSHLSLKQPSHAWA